MINKNSVCLILKFIPCQVSQTSLTALWPWNCFCSGRRFSSRRTLYLSLVVSVSLMKNSCHFSRNSSLYILKQINAIHESFTEMFSCLWVYGHSQVSVKEECKSWTSSWVSNLQLRLTMLLSILEPGLKSGLGCWFLRLGFKLRLGCGD